MGLSEKFRASLDAKSKDADKRVRAACALVAEEARKALSVQGTRTSPSSPGEPPRRQTGRGVRSIYYRVKNGIGTVGTNAAHLIILDKTIRPWFQAVKDKTAPAVRKLLFPSKR